MRRIGALLLSVMLLLTGCSARERARGRWNLACTTYPVYLLAREITRDVEGVELSLVVNQQVSCLHDYALTVTDMKQIEGADALAINGAGLEGFLGDLLEGRAVIDCDEGIALKEEDEHHHHEDAEAEGEPGHHHDGADPHIWMDPRNYAQMARNLAEGLAELDSAHAEQYLSNGWATAERLETFYEQLRESDAGQAIAGAEIITFHDGFSYFADAFDLHIAAAIEEEEGAEASARDLKETIAIVEEEGLPAVFTEVNGSANAARIICAECGIPWYPLSMVMSGSTGDDLSAYEAAIQANVDTIRGAYP